ncbi:MAG: hypothetical protein Q9190_002317 [Brigantiaea leucoxantha]
MDTPPSVPTSPRFHPDAPPSPIPLDSSDRTHRKHLLPAILSSTYPHGLLSGHPRTPEQQKEFDTRKAEIRNTMTKKEMEKEYDETTSRIKELLEERDRQEEQVERRIESLRAEREVERRVWEKVRGKRVGGM